MSEVKYAIAILKEKLANADRHNLAYQRLSIAEMEAIWGVLAKSDADYAALKAERDALAAKGMELAQEAAHVYAEYNKEMAPDVVCDGQTIQEFYDLANGWASVDAYLNSVRAEGVESFAHQQRVIADSLSGDEQRSHRITACRAEDFAAQLRSGEPS